jgi:hypothetical protein
MLYGIFSGGTIAAAFILAAEPASSAKLKFGILFTIVFGAVLSWFFRYKCMEFMGCFIALALINCLTPLVRIIEEKLFVSIMFLSIIMIHEGFHLIFNTILPGTGLLGYWFSMSNSTDQMLIFPIFKDGILIPLGAIVTPDNTVSEVIPLSAHAVQAFNSLPASILQMYIKRIEASAQANREGR